MKSLDDFYQKLCSKYGIYSVEITPWIKPPTDYRIRVEREILGKTAVANYFFTGNFVEDIDFNHVLTTIEDAFKRLQN